MLTYQLGKVNIGEFDFLIESNLAEEVQNLYDEIVTLAKLMGYTIKYRGFISSSFVVTIKIPTRNNYVIQFDKKNGEIKEIFVLRSFADYCSNIGYEKDIVFSLNIVKRGMLL